MKKIFKFAAIVAAAAALFSCQEKPTPEPTPDDKPGQEQEPENKEPNANIQFTLEIIDVTETTTKVKIKHDGAKTDTWHYFATTETEIADAIEAEVETLLAEGKSLQSSTSKTTTIRNLTPETEYTLVAFGITTEGTLYGEPETLAFETTAAPLEGMQINPAWYVEYVGEYEEGGQVYEDVVYVESTDNNTYFTTAWPKAYFDEHGIEAIAQAEIEGWLETFAEYNITWSDIIMSGSTLSQVAIYPELGNEWYILAIGVDTKGNLTGYYAMSDLVTFVEEEMTEGYAAWLGNWTFTGANGLTQDVTFSKGTANKTFKVTGYEGQNLEIVVLWDEENQCWQINNQNLGTYNFNGGKQGDIWFVGEDAAGALFLTEELPICMGGMLEDGTLACIPFESELDLGDGEPYPYTVADMLFLANFGPDATTGELQLSYISATYKTGYPTFPMTITPSTKAANYSAKEFMGIKKNVNKIRTFNTYGVR